MTQIEVLQVEINKLGKTKTKATVEQQFELAATLRNFEKIFDRRISEIINELQDVLKFASSHLQNSN